MRQNVRVTMVRSGARPSLLTRVLRRRSIMILTGREPVEGPDVYECTTASGTVLAVVSVRNDWGTSTTTLSPAFAGPVEAGCVETVGRAMVDELSRRSVFWRRIVCAVEPGNSELTAGLLALGFEREGWTPAYRGDRADTRDLFAKLTRSAAERTGPIARVESA